MTANPTQNIPIHGETRSDVWLQWYKELLDAFGKKEANSLLIKAWKLRGTSSANTLALRTELKNNGLQIDESLFDSVIDIGGGITSGITDFFGSAFTIGKYTGIAMLIVIIGGAGMIIYNVAKDPATAIGKATKAAL